MITKDGSINLEPPFGKKFMKAIPLFLQGKLFFLEIFLCGALTGCASAPEYPEEFGKVVIETTNFSILSYQKLLSNQEVVRIYIEGDGNAFNAHGRPSSDPTPRERLVRRMAFNDPHMNVIYLARPCQYVRDTRRCTSQYWTDARFSRKVIDAEIEALQKIAGNAEVVLIGFSGGAQIAGLVSVLPSNLNIRKVVTVAGNLDHEAWCRSHGIPSLKQSMSLNEYRQEFLAIPQTHFVAERDTVVNPEITYRFLGKANLIRMIKGAAHTEGWDVVFDEIWNEN